MIDGWVLQSQAGVGGRSLAADVTLWSCTNGGDWWRRDIWRMYPPRGERWPRCSEVSE